MKLLFVNLLIICELVHGSDDRRIASFSLQQLNQQFINASKDEFCPLCCRGTVKCCCGFVGSALVPLAMSKEVISEKDAFCYFVASLGMLVWGFVDTTNAMYECCQENVKRRKNRIMKDVNCYRPDDIAIFLQSKECSKELRDALLAVQNSNKKMT